MVINTNILALNSHRAMKNVGATQAQSSARLSSGLRINTAADDAAGLAISEKMRAQIRGLDMASKNAQDGISMVQTAEGGMTEIGNMVQRIRELTVQASNDSNDKATGDRTKIQREISNLLSEIDSMASRVEFNNKKLINGDYASTQLFLQVGANKDQAIKFCIGNMNKSSLGLSSINVDVSAASAISAQISTINAAVNTVANERAKLGAIQNRLQYTIKSLDISSENLSASESRIRDTDMAKEMMSLTKANVLSQAATAMLAQANQQPQNILQLLR
ncbi:MAG: flagellin [Firmicutes bacterium]|nr:flagellin [Bacillota bacterium]